MFAPSRASSICPRLRFGLIFVQNWSFVTKLWSQDVRHVFDQRCNASEETLTSDLRLSDGKGLGTKSRDAIPAQQSNVGSRSVRYSEASVDSYV
jgi:hypothetical protein